MIGFPFDSLVTYDEHGNPSYDRAVSSKPLKTLISKLFCTGISPLESDNLQVFAGSEGMTVVVHPGFCVIEGGLKQEENNRTLQVQAADTAYDRIDTVVMRWNDNDNARVCDLYVVEGTPAANPVRPELTRVGSIYEIGLADIFIPSNSSAVTQQRITDTRYESARCGVMSSVSEWDTTTIYAQVQADLADFKAEEQADFVAWYEDIKDAIDELTAAQLESEIQGLDTRVEALEDAGEGVTSFNTRTGAVTLQSSDVTGALGYTPPTQDTTYSDATQSVHGLMSAADKTKLDGVAANANNYSLPLAASGTRGGVRIGYTQSGQNYPVQLSSEKMYVNVPWENTTYSAATQSVAGLMSAADKKKLDGVATGANNYSLPLAASGTRGGIQIGFSESGNNYAVKLSSEKAYVTVAKTTAQVTRTATTYVPGTTAEASLVQINKTNVFNVKTANWATDATYGFKFTISTTEYTANSSPMWMMCSYSGATAVPSETELTEGAKVLVAMFTASDITLYAKEKPSVNLKLLVKGV